ncbi:hypothetical protein EDD53_1150 [Pacificibacter maritimus]|uniref:PH (Pleckstrin Homology) domain-containing protein n=1 Tax=Pacificibacter maritimus TaxID=762213 RepID=A0A3N4UNK2_9RHOB|nr:hypothetical protein [Pacificibacter maritimus]RPE72013.1 hypothetical protein EDD53_1150 [Pacificibacter maritimus]
MSDLGTDQPVQSAETTPLYRLSATIARRVSAVAILAVLGLLLLWILVSTPPAAVAGKAFLALMGGLALWGAARLWQATGVDILMTEDDLREENGRILCTMDQIERVERGTFAFKPSNGFVVVLKDKSARAWAPGLWWRMGRRIGVGGVTAAGAGKAMADVLAARITYDGRLD